MLRSCLAGLLIFLSSVFPVQADFSRALPMAEVKGYVLCMTGQARLIARQSGDPASLGQVATDMCPAEEKSLVTALKITYPPREVPGVLAVIKTRAAEKNAVIIVQERRKSISPGPADESAKRTQQTKLQDEWQECLYATGARFAKRAAFGDRRVSLRLLSESGRGLFAFFQNQDPLVAKMAAKELFLAIRKHFQTRLEAVVLQERTKLH